MNRTKPLCPKCRHEQLARIARNGFLRKSLFPIFGFYPWECGFCRRQFILRRRGVRRIKYPSRTANPAPQGAQLTSANPET